MNRSGTHRSTGGGGRTCAAQLARYLKGKCSMKHLSTYRKTGAMMLLIALLAGLLPAQSFSTARCCTGCSFTRAPDGCTAGTSVPCVDHQGSALYGEGKGYASC